MTRVSAVCFSIVLGALAVSSVIYGVSMAPAVAQDLLLLDEGGPPPDDRGERIEISIQLKKTQNSLIHTRRMVTNARSLAYQRATAVQTALAQAEDALREAQGELTRSRKDGE